jgi:hypothetical protein
MKKCDCWYVDNTNLARCNGTKEQDACMCGGDRKHCDFYPEIRLRAEKEIKVAGCPNCGSSKCVKLTITDWEARFSIEPWYLAPPSLNPKVCLECGIVYIGEKALKDIKEKRRKHEEKENTK